MATLREMMVADISETGWYIEATETYRGVLARVRPEQATWPTPCSDFDVLHLMSHGSSSPRALSGLLRGEPLEDIFSEILAGWEDPAEVRLAQFDERVTGLHAALRDLGAAVSADDIAVLVLGEVSWRENFAYCAYDLFVHSWDLSQAIDVAPDIPAASMEMAWRAIQRHDQHLRDAHMLAPRVEPAPDADIIGRIIAWSGRVPLSGAFSSPRAS